ncbi:hypothetical protein KQ306_03005 [Synechococcus sp. CS-1324]|uniref:hypothetical protein n=1 Tax=unclassified Synechococcus TaxID=2626047 RepID=UPI000DB032B8|nr:MULTISPECIES: hypothetical protein [unclassified Synechococcus]MCT0213010.1 hypothetical protein [Synechococcus sp. CS-1326]MCT0229832.1 hypothetical protein [Synechococcus sp. CS-1324]MCT0232255.1 hypothetical protein [Synechococcus sp. CS-1327]PZV06085.1 MAG: hypothetical protein DCF23_00910 [Cyanobium sp.]
MDSAQPRFSLDDLPQSAQEPAGDPGEDPFSPGTILENSSPLLGALIAILSLLVPIGGVMADRFSQPALPLPISASLGEGLQKSAP